MRHDRPAHLAGVGCLPQRRNRPLRPVLRRDDKGERAAIAICRTCRVQGECLAYAVRTRQWYGVWGGRPQRELRELVALDRLDRAVARLPSARHRNAAKERCEHGHPFDADNTYYTPTGERRCRTCRRDADQARRQRRRQPGRRWSATRGGACG
jgi:Transcription factor WhiB